MKFVLLPLTRATRKPASPRNLLPPPLATNRTSSGNGSMTLTNSSSLSQPRKVPRAEAPSVRAAAPAADPVEGRDLDRVPALAAGRVWHPEQGPELRSELDRASELGRAKVVGRGMAPALGDPP